MERNAKLSLLSDFCFFIVWRKPISFWVSSRRDFFSSVCGLSCSDTHLARVGHRCPPGTPSCNQCGCVRWTLNCAKPPCLGLLLNYETKQKRTENSVLRACWFGVKNCLTCHSSEIVTSCSQANVTVSMGGLQHEREKKVFAKMLKNGVQRNWKLPLIVSALSKHLITNCREPF